MEEYIGLIPAGGIGTRMKPFMLWKELIPVGYKVVIEANKPVFVPKMISEYTMDSMKTSGVSDVMLIINELKGEFIRVFGDGSKFGLNLSFLCQETSGKYYGMPIAIDLAYKWIKGKHVLLGMPDTIILPEDAFKVLKNVHEKNNSDLTLGIFGTEYPTRMAPVEFNSNNEVLRVYDKPSHTNIYNTWNIALWSPRFTELLHDYVIKYKNEKYSKEIVLSEIFNYAINNNLRVFGNYFGTGSCYDLGIMDDFAKIKQEIDMKIRQEICG